MCMAGGGEGPRYDDGGEGYRKEDCGMYRGDMGGWCESDWKACLPAMFLSIALRGDIGRDGLAGLEEAFDGERGGLKGVEFLGGSPPIRVSGTKVMLVQPF